ncbi:MAG TPA: DUF5335 family protein [Methylocella sp.]|nr:DUF5335 family protein [Methylocella sp.]
MEVRKLEKAEWGAFLEHLSKQFPAAQVEIDIGPFTPGGNVQTNWASLLGLAYDPKDDLIEVAVEGLDHMIRQPREIYLEQGEGSLASIEVIDAGGGRQMIKLKDALRLRPPGSK